MTKLQQLINNLNCSDYKGALRIAKNFFTGLTKEELSQIRLAHGCCVYPDFYRQLGRNLENEIKAGVDILVRKYVDK